MKIADLLTSPRIIKHKNPRFSEIPPRNDPKMHPNKSPSKCASKFQPSTPKRVPISVPPLREVSYDEKMKLASHVYMGNPG